MSKVMLHEENAVELVERLESPYCPRPTNGHRGMSCHVDMMVVE